MKKIINKLFYLSNKSYKNNEFPVSAIIFDDNKKVISYGFNSRNKSNLTIDHAEIIAIKKANKKIKSWRLNDYNMIVTLEPCDMCKSVIKESRIKKVYYLMPRLTYKKQFSKTMFEEIDTKNMSEFLKYKNKIITFFDSKR